MADQICEIACKTMLNGTSTLLQVQRVSTVISCTEMRWENAIEKLKMRFKCRFGFGLGLEKTSSVANSMGKLGAPDTEKANSNQMIHKVQRHTAVY